MHLYSIQYNSHFRSAAIYMPLLHYFLKVQPGFSWNPNVKPCARYNCHDASFPLSWQRCSNLPIAWQRQGAVKRLRTVALESVDFSRKNNVVALLLTTQKLSGDAEKWRKSARSLIDSRWVWLYAISWCSG